MILLLKSVVFQNVLLYYTKVAWKWQGGLKNFLFIFIKQILVLQVNVNVKYQQKEKSRTGKTVAMNNLKGLSSYLITIYRDTDTDMTQSKSIIIGVVSAFLCINLMLLFYDVFRLYLLEISNLNSFFLSYHTIFHTCQRRKKTRRMCLIKFKKYLTYFFF